MKKHNGYYIVQRNKYLEKIGLKPNQYGVNFTFTTDKYKKKWKKQRKEYGFDERETYCMDIIFAEWLYSHCKMFLEKSRKTIDLSYYKYDYNEKKYTQEEAIKKIIKWTKYYLKNNDSDDTKIAIKANKKLQKASELWTIVLLQMGW